MISAKILADSIGPSGCRLTTFELIYPRYIHAQLLTHRAFSRNAASSRAIPVAKMIEAVLENPVPPPNWLANQKGMQGGAPLSDEDARSAHRIWVDAGLIAISAATRLASIGVHKQHVNRVLEPYQHITTIVSATEYQNFFDQRCDDAAQPEMQALACDMRAKHRDAKPQPLRAGAWHMPLINSADFDHTESDRIRISVGRCARVSYLTHDGKRDIQADLDLCDRLQREKHLSPFEHVARAESTPTRSGNFTGWTQYRETVFGSSTSLASNQLGTDKARDS